MNAASIPASLGVDWLRQALRLLGRRPLSLVSAVLFGFLSLAILVLVPGVGPVLSAAAVPAVTLGMVCACRATDRGEVPNIAHYLLGLRTAAARRGLLVLGAFNAATLVPLSLLVQMASRQAPAGATAPDADLAFAPAWMALQFALSLPVLMAMLLAPPLVAWRALPAGKAMFFSFVACWRHRWALLVYLALVILIGTAADVVIIALVGSVTSDPRFAVAAAVPVSVGLLALLQCGTYRIYQHVFDPDSSGPATA